MLRLLSKRVLSSLAAAASEPGAARCFASMPAKVVDTSFGEFVRVAPGAPLLVRLRERGWGALAAIPAPELLEAGYSGADRPEHIAVVRDAFAAHDESPRLLADALQPVGPHKVAVAADITQPHERLVADQYQYRPDDDHYHLTSIGTDLLRFLRGQGVHLLHVPDVRAVAAAAAAHDAAAAAAAGVQPKQSTNEVLMVAPTAFVYNSQAAQDNSFMNTETGEALGEGVTRRVLKEFSGLYEVLTEGAGVKVNLFQHSLDHGTPDAVFPNNWFSTHSASEAGGGVAAPTLVYYPMKCPNRQAERRPDIQGVLAHLGYDRVVDMSAEERDGRYFEGTGVLVLDRVHGVAYVALSERAHPGLAARWVDSLGYAEAVTFRSSDAAGAPVYHTNVMMAVGTGAAVVCLESVEDEGERKNLAQKLARRHEVVDITRGQMAALAGNCLELEDGRGLPVLAMSTQAYNAFTPDQRKALRRHFAALHHAPVDTLERIGGGGVRCTLAEIFR